MSPPACATSLPFAAMSPPACAMSLPASAMSLPRSASLKSGLRAETSSRSGIRVVFEFLDDVEGTVADVFFSFQETLVRF